MILDKLTFRAGQSVRSILQDESAECGLACLAMVCGYHGHEVDLASLRRRFSVSTRGASLMQLINTASSLYLNSRALRVELKDLDQLQLPCILHWNMNHFVVLVDVRRQGVRVADPGVGLRNLTWAEASEAFTGVALELAPGPEFQKKKERIKIPFYRLVGNVVGLKRSLVQILTLAFALELLLILFPLATQWVVDGVVVMGDTDLLLVLALGLGVALVLRVVTLAARDWAVVYVSTSVYLQWANNLFSHLIRLPVDYFEKRQSGDILSRFGSSESIRLTLSNSFVGAILDGVMAAGTLMVMLIYSPMLAAISVVAVVSYIVQRGLSYSLLRSASAEELVCSGQHYSSFLESVRGITEIKLHNAEDIQRTKWLNYLVKTINRRLVTDRITVVSSSVQTAVFGFEGLLVLYLGAQLILKGDFSVGMFIAYTTFRTQFSDRVGSLIDTLIDLKMLGVHVDRLGDMVLTEKEKAADEPIKENWWLSRPRASLELKSIRFRYSDEEPWVLDGVNFCVAPGESVAIVGPSGCGKTTMAKVMLGLLKPQAGEILVDGVALANIGLKTFRRGIAAVMQDDQLLMGSIAENIAFFSSPVDMNKVMESARRADIHEDIVTMPMGYETILGDMGAGLSGGQKQRIFLARALYKEPSIVLLDEATSHLDISREKTINANIRALDITRIIIAHRPETIASADRVVRMNGGHAMAAIKMS